MQAKRITIFAGHYGSGKTNLALNYAFWLKENYPQVSLCDLDIVNPYFRTADSKGKLDEGGIQLITSPYANTNVEFLALPAEAQAVLDNREVHAVIDLGGDERGALALGRYARQMKQEDSYDMLLVTNPFRPLTASLEGLREVVSEMEQAARLPFTGLVNNANLGRETTLEDVLESLPFAKQAAKDLGLPLWGTALHRPLLEGNADILAAIKGESELFPIDLFEKPNWVI